MASFYFQIDEVRQRSSTRSYIDAQGHWVPSIVPGDIRTPRGATRGVWWYCDGTHVRQVDEPTEKSFYSAYSVFFSGGFGFRVLRGNATSPPPDAVYHPLGFQHDDIDGYSSSLTHVLQAPILRCHPPTAKWVTRLLPNTYHGPPAGDPSYGGLKGELPIFLALLALSMPATYLQSWLPHLYVNGRWKMHEFKPHWEDERGVVVTVYAVPLQGGGYNTEAIANLEHGHGSRYFA